MSSLSLKQVYAAYAPKVLSLLAKDHTARALFGGAIDEKIKRYDAANEKDLGFEQNIMPLLMAKLYPMPQKNAQVAAWLLKAYVNHRHNGKPILAEDFYKVAENLKYFDSLKSSGRLKAAGVSGDILSYKSYQAFLEMLKPFEDARDLKKAAEAMRKITPEQKEIITSETTILYDGKEGQIVIPHTPRAAQYWGGNTKWCLAGKEAETYFFDYHEKSPILFIIPKGLHYQKIALVDKTLWDAADNVMDALPAVHFALFQKMLTAQPADIARDIGELLGQGRGASKNEDWAGYLLEIYFDVISFKNPPVTNVPEELLRDKAFMLEAIKKDSRVLQFAPLALREDLDFMMGAIAINRGAIRYMPERLKADRLFVLDCAKVNIHCLEHMYFFSSELREAMTIKAVEELLDEGRAGEVKRMILRHDKESFGKITAQFGDETLGVERWLKARQYKMTSKTRALHHNLWRRA